MTVLAPPFPYFGGKQTLGPKIVDLLPRHRHYVEPYCGSLAVLLAKRPSYMETVNDLDGELMTFWRVLRDQPDEFRRVCALTPHSRAEQVASYDRSEDLPDIERARRLWVCLSQGRMGVVKRTGWRHHIDPAGSTVSMPGYLSGYVSRMASVAERLATVSLECQPALEIVERYGRNEEVLLYVDPPYLGSTRSSGGYKHEMTSEADHGALAEALQRCNASVVLSGYPSALYDELYADWHRVDFAAATGQSTKGVWSERTETVWISRAPSKDIDLFSVFDEDLTS